MTVADILSLPRPTNTYELLATIKPIIRAEPRRLHMDRWFSNILDFVEERRPACGTIACIGGWGLFIVFGPEESQRISHTEWGFEWAHLLFPPSLRRTVYDELFSPKGFYGPYSDVESKSGTAEYVNLAIYRIDRYMQMHKAKLKAYNLTNVPTFDPEWFRDHDLWSGEKIDPRPFGPGME